MQIKQTPGERVFNVANVLFMLLLMFITLYPFYYVVMASFSDPKLLLLHEGPLAWMLGSPTTEGYKLAFRNPNILTGFFNTGWNLVVGTLINITLTSFAAFVLTRAHFLPRNLMMRMMVVTMFFSGGLIPLFFVVRGVGIYNTRWANFMPYLISTYNVIIMRSFFASLPASLEESAIIDGANDWQVFWRITIPLSRPVIAVILLYYAVGHWNSWFPAMVFIRNSDLHPLQMVLRGILITNEMKLSAVDSAFNQLEISFAEELVKYCTIIISTVPILCVYPFLTKYFEKGVMIGAIKG